LIKVRLPVLGEGLSGSLGIGYSLPQQLQDNQAGVITEETRTRWQRRHDALEEACQPPVASQF
jgi:hypothetical protein